MYRLQEFSFETKYVPGVSNVNADCLSRLPISNGVLEEDDEWVVADVESASLGAISEREWKQNLQDDSVM